MSIADDVMKDVVTIKLQSNVMDIKSYMESMRFMADDIVIDLQTQLASFNPTNDIKNIINNFKLDSENLVLKFGSTYADGSNAAEGLTNLFNQYVCLGGYQEFIDMFNGYADIVNGQIQRINRIPEEFISWANNILIHSIMNRVRNLFPFFEFGIGVDLSALYNNLFGNNVSKILSNLNYLVNCLDNIGIDMTGELNEIYGLLDEMHINPDGSLNYNKLSVYVNTEDILNIKEITKCTNVVINNTMNEISKVTRNFQIPQIPNVISINPINPMNNPLSKYYSG